MKLTIITLLLLITTSASSQKKKEDVFGAPFDFPLTLSGNFGELRSNHFHGGLDFKTQGVSGKKVLALADGYITKILVTHGSGYVLHVKYNNGYTTINRHLSGFVSPIAERIKQYQYDNETWEVSIIPDSLEYPVKKGQQIAWSGNTGYSFGPHLHLDMLETATGDYIDPLPFFKDRIKDTRAPQAREIMFFSQSGKGAVAGSQDKLIITPDNKRPVEAWGLIGIGIKAYDYMDGANNRYGVHTVSLFVDGKEVSTSTVDRFSSYENRMINSWAYKNAYMKSFIDPGNTLRMLKAKNGQRGILTIDEERDYKCLYVLKDLYGNTSRYNFIIKGKKQDIQPLDSVGKYYLMWDKMNFIYEPGLAVFIPTGLLYDNLLLNYQVINDSVSFSPVYQIHDEPVYLHDFCEMRIGVPDGIKVDSTKYYIARVGENGKRSCIGGTYENGFMKVRLRELGAFTVAVDTVAPVITPVGQKNWSKNGRVVYKVTENETGIRNYKGTVDGKYALFGLEIMTNRIIYKLDPKRIKKGTKHTVELTVTDLCGNTSTVKDTLTW